MENQIDETITSEDALSSTPSVENQTTTEDSEVVKTPAEDSVPYHRFKEVIEEKNSYKNDLERMRTDIESLKAAKEPEPEPTTYQEVEERAVKKAMTQFEQKQATAEAKKRADEQALDIKFDQLQSIGQTITPEIRKNVYAEMIKTGSTDVVATFLEVKKSLDRTSKAETLKKESFIPPSHKGSPATSGYSYKEIKNKSIDQMLDEAG